ncbi:glycosyltransferase family 4 protein [Vibrio sp. 1288]|uniref:glycosyltransferase family 4 protein n=1 Tax=Vibrio sp. 1288 TaxID=3074550 RepID=UPI0029670FF9|nr:glycosyltransferase family 4 protein [Vibrio sp. 1288]MDW3137690.1 glycosyltransferase family 4 protein [Vibrio sp. 1288]
MTKKVVFVDRLGAHSIWNVLDPIAKKLVKCGFEVCYCRMNDGQQRQALIPPKGVKTVDIKVPHAKTKLHFIFQQLIWFFHFSRFILKFKPDLVHTNFVIPGALSKFSCKLFRKGKVVSTRHELKQSMNPLLQWLEGYTARHADHIAYITDTVKNSYNQNEVNCSIIYNGIDIELLNEVGKSNHPSPVNKIVCVGRILPVKGQALLLEAMPQVLSKHPNSELILIGAGSDESKIQHQATRLNIDSKVTITGWLKRQKVIEKMASSSLIVVPSDGTQEGFGLVVAEALALEVPIVCSDIPVFKEVAGNTAFMFKTGDSSSLANAIVGVLDEPKEAKKRADIGKKRVADMFTVDVMVGKYIDLYKTLLSK